MATYDERVVYDWSSPTQLNDWDIQYSGPAGSVAITNGKLVLAPNRTAISGVNLISKAIGFDALEMEFNTGNLGGGATRYLTLSFGTGGVCDDAGRVPGTDFWHQGMANSVTLHLQDPAATANGSFVRDYANGGRIERGYYPLTPGADLTRQNKVLVIFKPGEYQVWLNGSQILSIPTVTTQPPTKVMIHQGWYAPGVWGADTTISRVILYRGYDLYADMTMGVHPVKCVPANQEPRAVFQPQDVAWRGTPPLYPGPVNLQQQTQTPLCKGRDYFWIRDGVRNVEQGYIESTVTINGVGVRRRVLCFTQDGELVGETYSRASDGVYRFDLLWLNKRYMLVAQDDPAFGPADYNAVAADYQAPKPYPPGGGVAPAPFPMLAHAQEDIAMLTYVDTLRTSRAQLLATAIDTGSGPSATLTIYTGTRPAPGAAITDQLALVVLKFSHPCAKTVSGGVLTLKPLAEQMATASGAPTWGRITDRDGAFVADLDVGVPGSGADLEIPASEFFAGALIRINNATITEP